MELRQVLLSNYICSVLENNGIKLKYNLIRLTSDSGSRDCALVRALASHQCVPGSIPEPGVMWVEFVVGSRPCSEGFSPGSPVFLPPQKSTFPNSNSIGISRATGLSVSDCYVLPSLNKVD